MHIESCECLLSEFLPRGMADFFQCRIYMRQKSQKCLVVRDPWGDVIAAFRYQVRGAIHLRSVRALGTWVQPYWRGLGIGKALWEAMLEREKPRRVRVATISKAGHALVLSLAPHHPIIVHANMQ